MNGFENGMFLTSFENLVRAAHDNSKEKGFWGELSTAPATCQTFVMDEPNHGEKLMLMVSELAEAFEAVRKGKADAPCDKDCMILDPTVTDVQEIQCKRCDGKGTVPNHISEEIVCTSCAGTRTIKVTGTRRLTNMEEELADVVIRVADYCGYKGIDLGRCILAKMGYNRSRPYMHGKTC